VRTSIALSAVLALSFGLSLAACVTDVDPELMKAIAADDPAVGKADGLDSADRPLPLRDRGAHDRPRPGP
jgi:hypothetical protein